MSFRSGVCGDVGYSERRLAGNRPKDLMEFAVREKARALSCRLQVIQPMLLRLGTTLPALDIAPPLNRPSPDGLGALARFSSLFAQQDPCPCQIPEDSPFFLAFRALRHPEAFHCVTLEN
jgi:hypothetical protein